MMTSRPEARARKVEAFRALHVPSKPLVMPNPWDAGSARMLQGLGFLALATTSSGFALTQGRRDYGVSRDQVLSHCRQIVDAVDVPVSADLEDGFGASPQRVVETITLAAQAGLAGGSIEDVSSEGQRSFYERERAVERVAAAAEAARALPGGFVLTARADGLLYDETDLDGVIERLQAFARAGADVVYAPGIADLKTLQLVCDAVPVPVNALSYGGLRGHPVSAFGDAGVARISTGGRPTFEAYGTLAALSGVLEGATFDSADAGGSDAIRRTAKYLA